jgi:tetratricopeptide (TPR) repeat protein
MRSALTLLTITLATGATLTAARAEAPHVGGERAKALPFIEDDYPAALSRARQEHLPLFVDAWAPWCHSCRSMRAYVFTDSALADLAGRFVWLEIDTEKEQNATFVGRFPLEGLPTLFIIDPNSEAVLIRRLGSATVAQLREMAAEGERAFRGAQGWRSALVEADRLYGEGKNSEAALAYASVLAAAPKDWPERGRAVEARLLALQSSDQTKACAEEARDAYPALRDTPAAVGVALTGLDCALALPAPDAARAPLVRGLEAAAREVVANPKVIATADDRSGLYLVLNEARQDAKDEAGARAVAAEWARFLEAEAAKATTPDARAVLDAHRLLAYEALGQPERAIPMFQASERELPDDYNPPARLALAFQDAKRYDEALAASDRALAKVYGPRRITVLRQRAEILVDKGDTAAGRKVLEQALALARAQPAGPRSERAVEGVEERLAELKGP